MRNPQCVWLYMICLGSLDQFGCNSTVVSLFKKQITGMDRG